MGEIYKITNKINGKIYIGQTIHSANRRFYQHIYNAENNLFKNSALYGAINKYGKNNFYIETIEDNIPTELLDKKEIYYINEYDSIVPSGYNISIGGHSGIYPVKEVYKIKLFNLSVIKEYSTPLEACKDNGYNIYDHLYYKASVSLDGCFYIYKDEYLNDSDINNRLLKMANPICQLDEYGNIIGYHRSLRSAGIYAKIPWTNIRACCRNKMLSTNKIQWCYYKDLSQRIHKSILDMSPYSIEQLSLNNKLIKVWDEAKNAALHLGVNDSSSISKCCKNKQKTAYGYKWRYHNEERKQCYEI